MRKRAESYELLRAVVDTLVALDGLVVDRLDQLLAQATRVAVQHEDDLPRGDAQRQQVVAEGNTLSVSAAAGCRTVTVSPVYRR